MKFKFSGKVSSEAGINSLQQQLQLPLPGSYRKFLLRENGGRPEQSVFSIQGLEGNPSGSVNFLFGLNAEIAAYDLKAVVAWAERRAPRGIVPIGDNGGGDYICLDLRNGKEQVVFWDQRHSWSTGEWREQDLYPIADTFEEFLFNLRDAP